MQSGSKPLVAVDAFNLALSQGTGIAGYTRTLIDAIERNGLDLALMYGLKMHRASSALPRDVSFFDDKSWDKPGRTTRLRRALNAARTLAGGLELEHIERNGMVDTAALGEQLPAAELYNGHDLFNTASALQALTGRFLSVRMRHKAALCHWTSPLPIRLEGAPNIYTIHDLVPLTQPFTTLHDKARFHALLRRIAEQADHIVTVSEFSRSEIIQHLGVAPDKVTNTYQSVSVDDPGAASPATEQAFLEARFGLQARGYFLFVGAIEPKKNVRRLLEAYLAAETTMPLVVVGHRAWKSDSELAPLLLGEKDLRPVYDLGQGKKVIFPGYTPRSLMLSLMRNARALLFPSLTEGFGLPVAEAMMLGTPVLTANRAATAEIAGDAALLIDPLDGQAIKAGIERLAQDDELRSRLAGAGPRRAQLFSAEAYARRLADFYSKLGVHSARPTAGEISAT